MTRSWAKYVGLAALAAAIVALVTWEPSSAEAPPHEALSAPAAPQAATLEAAATPAAIPAPPLARSAARAGAPAAAAVREPDEDEPALMARLRELKDSNPELSLELARKGNARFVHSEDAPERAWFIVRSLVNLRRFDEARAEARVMADTYRDTPWALDVERHLLVHPGSTPEPARAE